MPPGGGAASWLDEPPASAHGPSTGAAPEHGGVHGTPPTATAAWTAPLKPGLIPLRPLQFGDVLSATFRLLRTSPGVTVGSAIIVLAGSTLFSGLITGLVAFAMFDRAASATATDRPALETTATVVTMLTAFATVILSLAASALLQGVLTHVVQRAAVAERATFGEAWRTAIRRGWPLIGYTALIGGGSLVLVAGLYALLLLPILFIDGSSSGTAAMLGFSVLGLFGYFALLAGLLALGVKLLFAAPAIVLEGLGPIAAIRRSWSLTKGHFWRLLGITLLVQTIASVVAGAVSAVLQFILPMLMLLLVPLGMQAEGQAWIIVTVAIVVAFLAIALQIVVSALTLVLIAGNAVILYLDVRMRKEGLGIYLQRYRDAAAEGREPEEDPYTAPPIDMPEPQPYAPQPHVAGGYAAASGYGMPVGYAPAGYAPQGYAPQGYAPAGYEPQGYEPAGYGPQGYAPQGYAPQPDAPTGYAPQGTPPAASGAQPYAPPHASPAPDASPANDPTPR